jgi:hypothetical protein
MAEEGDKQDDEKLESTAEGKPWAKSRSVLPRFGGHVGTKKLSQNRTT